MCPGVLAGVLRGRGGRTPSSDLYQVGEQCRSCRRGVLVPQFWFLCFRCEENCLSCSGPRSSCSKCKAGFSLISRTCLKNASCSNGKSTFT